MSSSSRGGGGGMKCDDATRYLSWAAYAGLAVAVGVSLYNGPVTKYQRNETSLVTGEIEVEKLDGLQYPTLVVCHIAPRGPENRSDEENFREYLEREETWHPYDYISQIRVIPRMKESKEVDLEHHMRPMVADVHWFKVCFTMEMQPVMAKYLEGNQTEARYSTMFGIGFKEVQPDSSVFVVFIVDKGEEQVLSLPPLMKGEVGKSVVFMEPGMGGFYQMGKEYRKMMRKCSHSQRLAACVKAKLDQKFGQCSGNVTAIRGGGCETEKVVERLVYLETLKFEGLAPIKKETGCELPCERMRYLTTPMNQKQPIEVVFSNKMRSLFPGGKSIIIIKVPHTSTFPMIREVLSYDGTSLLGDVGGYLGLFLGFSFFSLFDLGKDALLFAAAACGLKQRKATSETVPS